MRAIATLVQDDPYLKLSVRDRIAARAERRANIAANGRPDTPISLPRFITRKPRLDPAPILQDLESPVAAWAKRQFEIHAPPKEPWFSVEEDLGPVEGRPPSIHEIQSAVVVAFPGVSISDINSARRTANVVRPRQVAMYLVKTLTLRSLSEIGRRFGGRDHTAVLHAVRKIARLVNHDSELAAQVERIKASLA